jgi:hypothetical protein
MHIQTIEFRREYYSEYERGILINEGHGPIIDKNGKVVTSVWDYRKTLTLVVDLTWVEESSEK